MGIARPTYNETSAPGPDDTAIVAAIAAICDEFECCDWRRVQAAFRQQGAVVNHKKIKHLMREHVLQPRTRRRYVATTDSDHEQPNFSNRARDVVVDGPNQLGRGHHLCRRLYDQPVPRRPSESRRARRRDRGQETVPWMCALFRPGPGRFDGGNVQSDLRKVLVRKPEPVPSPPFHSEDLNHGSRP
jgi:hypothetical protein